MNMWNCREKKKAFKEQQVNIMCFSVWMMQIAENCDWLKVVHFLNANLNMNL